MLTQEDIEFIQLLIDDRINASKAKGTETDKDYHTTHAIRALIRQTLPEFRQWVGTEPFPLDMLRFFLRSRANLLPSDLETISAGKGKISHVTRFDNQVGNAIHLSVWPDSPFRPVRTGYYRLLRHD